MLPPAAFRLARTTHEPSPDSIDKYIDEDNYRNLARAPGLGQGNGKQASFASAYSILSVGSPKTMNFMPWKKMLGGYQPSSGLMVARPSAS